MSQNARGWRRTAPPRRRPRVASPRAAAARSPPAADEADGSARVSAGAAARTVAHRSPLSASSPHQLPHCREVDRIPPQPLRGLRRSPLDVVDQQDRVGIDPQPRLHRGEARRPTASSAPISPDQNIGSSKAPSGNISATKTRVVAEAADDDGPARTRRRCARAPAFGGSNTLEDQRPLGRPARSGGRRVREGGGEVGLVRLAQIQPLMHGPSNEARARRRRRRRARDDRRTRRSRSKGSSTPPRSNRTTRGVRRAHAPILTPGGGGVVRGHEEVGHQRPWSDRRGTCRSRARPRRRAGCRR